MIDEPGPKRGTAPVDARWSAIWNAAYCSPRNESTGAYGPPRVIDPDAYMWPGSLCVPTNSKLSVTSIRPCGLRRAPEYSISSRSNRWSSTVASRPVASMMKFAGILSAVPSGPVMLVTTVPSVPGTTSAT